MEAGVLVRRRRREDADGSAGSSLLVPLVLGGVNSQVNP